MVPPLDIFRIGKDGERWIEVVADLQTAKARIAALGETTPGEYLIYSHGTGHKQVIVVGDGSGHTKK